MGLPEILIEFKQKAETAVRRSGDKTVALILRDTENAEGAFSKAYNRVTDVMVGDMSPDNYNYVKLAFKGAPKRVLVELLGAEDNLSEVLGRLKNKKWDYLSMPDIRDNEAEEIAEFIKAQRTAGREFKAVLPKFDANDEGIINFATENIVCGDTAYTTAEYCARIAGVAAGTNLNQSCTYEVLDDITSVTESADPDGDIDAGKLIIINDGVNFKIARGVTSLTTLSSGKTEDLKKIKIVEAMDMIRKDIKATFEENYIGIANNYDNKILFINAVNVYFKGLEREGVLYDEYLNEAYIDTVAQRNYLEGIDISYAEMGDNDIKKAPTGSKVFCGADVHFCDAIEDLSFGIYM